MTQKDESVNGYIIQVIKNGIKIIVNLLKIAKKKNVIAKQVL